MHNLMYLEAVEFVACYFKFSENGRFEICISFSDVLLVTQVVFI